MDRVVDALTGRMRRRLGLLALAWLAAPPRAAWARPDPEAAPEPEPLPAPGGLMQWRVDIPEDLRRLAAQGARSSPARVAWVTAALPPGFEAGRDWPVLLVNATSDPGHSASRALLAQYRAAASAAGWVVLAADPEPAVSQDDDVLALRFVLGMLALAAVQPLWRHAAQTPLALAGFSGGAKYAGWLSALFTRQGRRVAGVYLAGINQDPLLPAAEQLGVLDDAFRGMPVFLQSGTGDRVATPTQHRRIQAGLANAGFTRLKLATVERGHEVDATPLPEALAWFAEVWSLRFPSPSSPPASGVSSLPAAGRPLAAGKSIPEETRHEQA